MKLGHSSLIFITNFLSKSALFFYQDELNFVVFSKFWSYFKEHFDLGFLWSSSQAAWKWMRNSEIILVHISEQLLLQLWFFPYIFLAHAKFVFFSNGSYLLPHPIPWLLSQCCVQDLKQLLFSLEFLPMQFFYSLDIENTAIKYSFFKYCNNIGVLQVSCGCFIQTVFSS